MEVFTMPLIINTNVSSMIAQRNLTNNTNMLNRSIEKLSSGYRINRAGDDAAGLQVSENLRAQIRGSKKALDNVQDGINVMNIADGALSVITDNIQRMRELAVQAANDTYDVDQRTAIQQEINARIADIDRISDAVQFNGVPLIDGSLANMILQVGPNSAAGVDDLDVSGAFANADFATLSGGGATLVDTHANALTALATMDTAIVAINSQRATLGSYVNQLESAAQNLMIGIENLSSSESRIRNVDVAAESAELVKAQILQQSAATVLAQANQGPALALQLLQS
jgi:flagellin